MQRSEHKASSSSSPFTHHLSIFPDYAWGRMTTYLAALAALCSSKQATKATLRPMVSTKRKSNNPRLPDKITTHREDVESIAKMGGNAQSEETG